NRERREPRAVVARGPRVEPGEGGRLERLASERARDHRPAKRAAPGLERAGPTQAVLDRSGEHLEAGRAEFRGLEQRQIARAADVEPHAERLILRGARAIDAPARVRGSGRAVASGRRARGPWAYGAPQLGALDPHLAARTGAAPA